MAFYGSKIGAAASGGAIGSVVAASRGGVASTSSAACDPKGNKPNQFCCGGEQVTVSCTDAYRRGFSDDNAEDYCDTIINSIALKKFGKFGKLAMGILGALGMSCEEECKKAYWACLATDDKDIAKTEGAEGGEWV